MIADMEWAGENIASGGFRVREKPIPYPHPSPDPVAPPAEATEPDAESAPCLAQRARGAIQAVQRARCRLIRLEARGVHALRQLRAADRLGFSSFADFSREALQMHPRTARRRLTLEEILRRAPELEAAFLAGRLGVSQVLALRPLVGATDLTFWVHQASRLALRDLKERIRERGGSGTVDDPSEEDETGMTVHFAAPWTAAAAWEEALETASKVLGYRAPRCWCVDAILSEASSSLGRDGSTSGDRALGSAAYEPSAGDDSNREGRDLPGEVGPAPPADGTAGRPSGNPTPELPIPHRSAALDRLRQTVSLAERELRAWEPWDAVSIGSDLQALLALLAAVQAQERPLRLLLGRLVRDLAASRAFLHLGHFDLYSFIATDLGLSERGGRSLVSQAALFDDQPSLALAFRQGRIGMAHAFLIRRVASPGTLADYVRRAERVTVLQFSREIRWMERLAEAAPGLRARFAGAFPHPDLEAALTGLLIEQGWTPDPRATTTPLGPGDPAEDPELMRRLETLLTLLMIHGGPETAGGPKPLRQTLSPCTTIRFWLPAVVYRSWRRLLAAIRARSGPLPTWAAAILLARMAVHEWKRRDPAYHPTEECVMKRDEYACQVPGCSARSRLEAHHIVYRSRGGSDHAWNKITLCHHHHRYAVHAGVLRVAGTAPSGLTWEMGRLDGGQPFRILKGHRIIFRRPRATR